MALHSSHGSYMCDDDYIGLSLCAYTADRLIMVATCFYGQLKSEYLQKKKYE